MSVLKQAISTFLQLIMLNVGILTASIWRKGYKLVALKTFSLCFKRSARNPCETILKSSTKKRPFL